MPDPLQGSTPDRPASRRFGHEGLQLAARAFQALRLDPPGLVQAFGGLVIALITLFSSYEQLSLFGHRFQLQRQWGLFLLLGSVRQLLWGLVTTARHLGATLNWRRDPGYVQRMKQLVSEIAQLSLENAREKALSASISELCFPSESSSIPLPATATDCRPSSP